MAKETFIYGVARIRANESSLLTMQDMEHLLHTKTEQECLRYLRDKGWQGADSLPLEEVFSSQESRIYELVEELVSDLSILDTLRIEKDFHNIKTGLREIYLQKSFDELVIAHGSLSMAEIRQNLQNKDFESFPKDMSKAIIVSYKLLLETGDAQLADSYLDRACLEVMQERALQTGDDFLIGYANMKAAITNINIVVRSSLTKKSKQFYQNALAKTKDLDNTKLIAAALQGQEAIEEYLLTTPYASCVEALEKDFSTFEKWRDDTMMEYIHSQKYAIENIGPIAAFIIARENEIRSVRIIISGKRNHFAENEIRERVRKTYV